MGHQNVKKIIYSETLHKTESPQKKIQQHDTLGENLRGWGGGGGGCLCHIPPPTSTPPLTLKLKCHNIIDMT